jgi:transposase
VNAEPEAKTLSSLQRMATDIAAEYVPPATGNHSLITDTVAVTEFLDAVSKGNYIETACKAAGISKQTVYQWLKRAEHGETPFTAFRDALEKAEAKAELEVLETVRKAGQAGPQYWPASMTLLERRHPEKWGKRQDAESGPKVVVQIGIQASDVSVSVVSAPVLTPLTAISTDYPQANLLDAHKETDVRV